MKNFIVNNGGKQYNVKISVEEVVDFANSISVATDGGPGSGKKPGDGGGKKSENGSEKKPIDVARTKGLSLKDLKAGEEYFCGWEGTYAKFNGVVPTPGGDRAQFTDAGGRKIECRPERLEHWVTKKAPFSIG